MLAAGLFYSPHWITNDPVSPCAAFTFRLTQVLQTNLARLLFLNSTRLKIIDYRPHPHGSLHKQLHLNMMGLLRQAACGEKRSISSFVGKNANDVTRDVPQPTDTRYKLFLARIEPVCCVHARPTS